LSYIPPYKRKNEKNEEMKRKMEGRKKKNKREKVVSVGM